MSGKAGALSVRPTELPARYRRLFAWDLDRRSKAVREIAADQVEQWQALGGVDSLSPQELAIVERVVFLRRRVLAYESAILHNNSRDADAPERPLPMDAGTYSNHVNVLLGLLKALGISRRQRPVKRLHEVMRGEAA
jgi:hypothetical protein